MKKFNINNTVKVKLTDKGKKIFLEDIMPYESLANIKGPKILSDRTDSYGCTSFQLWSLMKLYGEYMGATKDLVFKTEILIDEKHLEELL